MFFFALLRISTRVPASPTVHRHPKACMWGDFWFSLCGLLDSLFTPTAPSRRSSDFHSYSCSASDLVLIQARLSGLVPVPVVVQMLDLLLTWSALVSGSVPGCNSNSVFCPVSGSQSTPGPGSGFGWGSFQGSGSAFDGVPCSVKKVFHLHVFFCCCSFGIWWSVCDWHDVKMWDRCVFLIRAIGSLIGRVPVLCHLLKEIPGGCGHRSRCLSHAKRALYHLS